MFILIIFLVSLLVSVGFFTLLERKILGLTQLRLGPNKTSLFGTLQPILDGVKLLKKLSLVNSKMYVAAYSLLSSVMFLLSLILWVLLPFYLFSTKNVWMLFILAIISLSSICFLFLGWSTMNKYSFLGSIRSLSQILSFEVNFSLILLLLFITLNTLTAICFSVFVPSFNYLLTLVFLSLVILESQRAPMDLSESESELVSGYNIEFSSLFFTLIFLSEYLNMLLLVIVFCYLMLKVALTALLPLLFLMLVMRSCYPRIRYDILMQLFWLKMLPAIFLLFILYYPLKFL